MAATLCPNGHPSATADYCDQCGAKIGSVAPPMTDPLGTPATAAPASSCPNCESPSGSDEKFCEVCGYDFVTGTMPAAPATSPASPPQPVGAPAAAPARAASSAGGPRWLAVVTADREYYERIGANGVPFPGQCPERVFDLVQDEVLIGRRSDSRGIHPQIDLSGAPEDTAISRAQAILRRQADGTWTVVDPGSTNGTVLNDAADPIAPNAAVALKDGDRLYVGAWTRIEFRAPPPP